MCLDCDDRSRYTPGRVGVYSVVHNRIGGTETFWRTLNKMIGIAGMATPQQPKAKSIYYPVFAGDEAIEELAASVDALLIWGITNKEAVTRGPVRIAMHHGSLRSQWANAVFEDELRWCERAVAINEEVAKHYGAEYIPNAVELETVANAQKPYRGKKVVVWLHRDAQEKRPHLARKIADALPDGWIMVATLPRERATTKLQAIGQTEEISHWLSLADVFLSTSDQEGFGLSMAEAMLAGVPVVSSPFGLAENPAIADQVHSEDVAEWVSAILNAGSKVEAAKAYVEQNHSLESIAKKWTNFLDRIL
jgi:glycosyltransferase involved in cell wall biosynthesis